VKKIDVVTLSSVLIGTILEWYDFSLLGSMASMISIHFFPSKTPLFSLMATFAVFASGFIARPIGGILFGHIGDRRGRRSALSLTIILMAVPTTLIGLLPTYETIGILAPIALIALRLMQGFAASGEYPGAICFLTEIAPPNKRGFWGSISMFGVAGGILLASAICSILSAVLSNDQMHSWGWRVPFVIGLPLGVVGWYLRCKVRESDIFTSATATNEVLKLPFKQVLQFNFVSLIKVILLFALSTISFYLGFVYIAAYLVSAHKLTFHQALLSNTVGTMILILFIPLFGYLSDKINRKYIMIVGAGALFIFSYPIFTLFLEGNLYGLMQGQIVLSLFIAMLVGPMSAAIAEVFSTLTRYSGIAAGLNIGTSLFGGTCPLIATYLVNYSGYEAMPCIYPMLFSFLCLVVIFSFQHNPELLLNEATN